jgi:hypothetical protein
MLSFQKDRLEAIKRYRAVLLPVVLYDQLPDDVTRDLLSKLLERVLYVLLGYKTGRIRVENVEQAPHASVRDDRLDVERRTEKLRVVNLSVALVVKFFHDRAYLFLGQILTLFFHKLRQFSTGDQPGAVLVEKTKLFSQRRDFLFVSHLDQEVDRCSFQV